jgi:hypothetical protein
MQAAAFAAPIHPDALLDQDGAGAFLKISTRTLEDWRTDGFGPRFLKIGARVRYRVRDLIAWIDERAASSTSG